MEQNKSKIIKAFQIITAILYAFAVAFVVMFMIDILGQGPEESLGTAVAIIVLIPLGAIALSVPLISSLIGLIISIVKKEKCGVNGIVYFIVFTVLPIITYFVMILIFKLIL